MILLVVLVVLSKFELLRTKRNALQAYNFPKTYLQYSLNFRYCVQPPLEMHNTVIMNSKIMINALEC